LLFWAQTSFSADCNGTRYTVKSGDSWSSIQEAAKRSGTISQNTTKSQIAAASGVENGSTIHPGDVLCLPAPGNNTPAPVTTAAPRGSGSTNSPPRTSGNCSGYVVRSGDSWSRIATTLGIRKSTLQAANGANDKTPLYPDQCLATSGTSAPATTLATSASTTTAQSTAPRPPYKLIVSYPSGSSIGNSKIVDANGTVLVTGQAGRSVTDTPNTDGHDSDVVTPMNRTMSVSCKVRVTTEDADTETEGDGWGCNGARAAPGLALAQLLATPNGELVYIHCYGIMGESHGCIRLNRRMCVAAYDTYPVSKVQTKVEG
jgi:LysM repeat protein